ncbi:MAG: hypothetical protein NC115_10905 [Bacteroidales bacterium]|nr:hypothetical protein [Bacteroidales bacterium]
MRRISVILTLVSCVCASIFQSCDKLGTDDEAYDSTFVVESERIVNVDVNGGKITVNYSIDGPKEGNKASVSTNRQWIHVGSVYNTAFSFTVDPNDEGEDRNGEITMTCSGTKPVTLHIIQGKEKSEAPVFSKFDIRVSDVTTSTARVQIIPVDAAVSYFYSIVSKADYDAYGAERYIERRIEQIREFAAISGGRLDSFLNRGTFDTAALPASQAPSLLDDTDYYVAVFDLAFDAQGKASYSGFVELKEFRSGKATPVDMSFTLAMSGNVLTVKPSSSSYTYICDMTSKAIWDSYASPVDIARDFVATMKSYGRLDQYIWSGVKSEDFSSTIDKGGDFVAYAVGYRNAASDSGITTEVCFKEFSF